MLSATQHHGWVDTPTPDERLKQAQLMMKLFERWQLDTAAQLALLGMSSSSRAQLTKYRSGAQGLPANRDVQDRVGWLLAIHKALRLLYPKNSSQRYSWVARRNEFFNHRTPLDVMQEEGLIGIARVARFLDYVRGA